MSIAEPTKAELLAEVEALRRALADAHGELQQKNEALTQAHAQVTETLEQQTATSEILKVISSSPTDVQPVFDAIVRSTERLCRGIWGDSTSPTAQGSISSRSTILRRRLA